MIASGVLIQFWSTFAEVEVTSTIVALSYRLGNRSHGRPHHDRRVVRWWEANGRTNLENRKFNCVLWFMNVKNRFPDDWRDQHHVVKQELVPDVKEWKEGEDQTEDSVTDLI